MLSRWFQKWADAFPTHEVTKLQIATYAEALDDLTPKGIELGCREATRTAEQFPKPGHIRAAYKAAHDNQDEFLGPRLDWNPELEKERIEREKAFKKLLAEGKVERAVEPVLPPKKKVIAPAKSVLTIAEQKAVLRKKGFL